MTYNALRLLKITKKKTKVIKKVKCDQLTDGPINQPPDKAGRMHVTKNLIKIKQINNITSVFVSSDVVFSFIHFFFSTTIIVTKN